MHSAAWSVLFNFPLVEILLNKRKTSLQNEIILQKKTRLHITEKQWRLLRLQNELWELRALKTAQLPLVFVGIGAHV